MKNYKKSICNGKYFRNDEGLIWLIQLDNNINISFICQNSLIDRIKYYIFWELNTPLKIETISLARNKLIIIEEYTFDPVINLCKLDISFNNIAKLQYNTFRNNIKLITLLANNNRLKYFDVPLEKFNSLEFLNLAQNQFKGSLPSHHFKQYLTSPNNTLIIDKLPIWFRCDEKWLFNIESNLYFKRNLTMPDIHIPYNNIFNKNISKVISILEKCIRDQDITCYKKAMTTYLSKNCIYNDTC